MNQELFLKRKWTLRCVDRQVVFVKRSNEKASHVVMKALLWALYLPEYPDLTVELSIGDRYKPDVVSLSNDGIPRFWGEAGAVGVRKIESLVRRYRNTHFAIAKWDQRIDQVEQIVRSASARMKRSAPFDLIRFEPDSVQRFINTDGQISIHFEAVNYVRVEP